MTQSPDASTIDRMSKILDLIHKLCHLEEYGEEDMRHEYHGSEPKVKSCYTCAFFGETGNPRCTNAQAVVDAPWETRDPPRSAVFYDKGCELFQSSDGKANSK